MTACSPQKQNPNECTPEPAGGGGSHVTTVGEEATWDYRTPIRRGQARADPCYIADLRCTESKNRGSLALGNLIAGPKEKQCHRG